MGFIIWYKVQIEEATPAAGGLLAAAASLLGIGLPVKVSNDVLSGQYILDSDITLTMLSGAFASTFDIRLMNLPQDITAELKSKQDKGTQQNPPQPLLVKVFLGYFDDLPAFRSTEPVMVGVITRLKSEVNSDGIMETTIRGQELTGFKLRMKCNPQTGKAAGQPLQAFVESMLQGTSAPDGTAVKLDGKHGLTTTVKDFTLAGQSVLDALRQLAQQQDPPLPIVLRDNQVLMNKAVGAGPAIDTLTEDNNIVQKNDEQVIEELRERCKPPTSGQAAANGQAQIKPRPGLSITVLGNPKLRVGQLVTVKDPDKTKDWRIEGVQHKFSTASGYTCDLTLVDAKPGEVAGEPSGAHGVVQRVLDVAEAAQRNPIDVGEVKEYTPGSEHKHLVTLNYGQSPPGGTVAPSVVTPVDDAVSLFNKPIVSPFAFHKCGLIVPLYPKMRALLAHNRGLTNDAMVAGFLWAENPRLEPPENKPGDYWLCLPTELTNGLPSGKGVNDLTDASGQRVIQAKGLKIFVGDDGLAEVGKRPDVPDDLHGTIVIEHQKGAKITITGDGAITIETHQQDISLTNGAVTLKLSGTAVEVS
jgi:hypothetical protein